MTSEIELLWHQGGVDGRILLDTCARVAEDTDPRDAFFLFRLQLRLAQRDKMRFRDRGHWVLLETAALDSVTAMDEVPMFRVRFGSDFVITGVYTRPIGGGAGGDGDALLL
jgi:hypothetical protein